jgi:hypothetical protein
MALQTEFEFTLPKGLVNEDGSCVNTGSMRLATARDEIQAMADARVVNNEAYLPVILLARVITRLGNMDSISPSLIENLFAADLAFLEDIYLRINNPEPITVEAVCPQCSHLFQLQVAPLES